MGVRECENVCDTNKQEGISPVLNRLTISLASSTSLIGMLLVLSIVFNFNTPRNVTDLFTSSKCLVYALNASRELRREACCSWTMP